VNVGCIPKKIMHYSGLLGHSFRDAYGLGWNVPQDVKHNWKAMVHNIDDYIKGLNFNYKKQLVDARVEYINAFAHFVDAHTVEYTDEKGNKKQTTADKFIIAVGGRPKYPTEIEGVKLAISSDDIFWMEKPPGKTLW
jgi:pyruvate/2-oxoglutarate dehydrogenase complex dihydrolipoamide dehydrogenase (E3) component